MPAQRGRASSSRDKSPARSMQTAPRRAKQEWCRPLPSLSLNFHGLCTKRETINHFGGIVRRARHGGRSMAERVGVYSCCIYRIDKYEHACYSTHVVMLL